MADEQPHRVADGVLLEQRQGTDVRQFGQRGRILGARGGLLRQFARPRGEASRPVCPDICPPIIRAAAGDGRIVAFYEPNGN
ncbi:hypothetical protein [Streptomyces sp. V1I6]|uniref:hypothetical protein n=1 Tax=Streptomyces sp. V1I6 TaxID=3042273 RepID=UPI0027816FA4|nr:hypothetical protein [Streptomyces sp. V1I6]MDQ0845675.1 hypothetical protein [Streptomyces sp. V1I6]